LVRRSEDLVAQWAERVPRPTPEDRRHVTVAPRIHGEITIDRDVADVFDFVANECNEPAYNPEMLSAEKATDGPIGRGSQFRAVMRSGRRELPMVIAFTTFERPQRLGSHSEMGGMSIDGELTFEPVGDSTLMRWEWQINTKGAMRLLSPVVRWIGRRQEARIWASLKQHLEASK
jgi:hypothetical protein